MLRALALHFWRERQPAMKIGDLEDWFDFYVADHKGLRLAASREDGRRLLQAELRNASLLVREQEETFRFDHTSFYEYFLACARAD